MRWKIDVNLCFRRTIPLRRDIFNIKADLGSQKIRGWRGWIRGRGLLWRIISQGSRRDRNRRFWRGSVRFLRVFFARRRWRKGWRRAIGAKMVRVHVFRIRNRREGGKRPLTRGREGRGRFLTKGREGGRGRFLTRGREGGRRGARRRGRVRLTRRKLHFGGFLWRLGRLRGAGRSVFPGGSGGFLGRFRACFVLFVCLFVWLFGCLIVCLIVWLFVCSFVCLFVCLFDNQKNCLNWGMESELLEGWKRVA